MPSSPGPVGSTRMAFRMTIGLPRPWPGYPHHTGLISASCTSNPRFRHRLSSDPALRRTPLPRRMVPVITVHRGLPPPECTSLLDTPGETACPTLLDQSFWRSRWGRRFRLPVDLQIPKTVMHPAAKMAAPRGIISAKEPQSMLTIPGRPVRTCEGWSRRELLRVGGAGLLGLNLPDFLAWKASAAAAKVESKAKAFGAAKSVIMLFLQGGPSHIDIWDPKPDAPSNIRGEFKPINTKVSGTWIGEHMPMMAQHLDKATLIRSMSYTPNGLFNHTAAIYQMLTGYPPDRVSPSGQLEPPSPADFPTAGSQVSKLKPPTDPVVPFVELPRPLQESGIIGKGGSAGFLGKAYDPYRRYQDPAKPVKLEDLSLRKDIPPERLRDRFELLKGVNDSMPDLQKALKSYAIDEYYGKAFDLVLSGKARDAFDLTKEPDKSRARYGLTTFGQGLLLSRRLIEAGTRFVQMNWPSVANGNPEVDSWDTHAANFGPLKNLHCPKLDRGLSALLEDMNDRGMLKETLVVAIGEFGRSPRLGVSTSGNSNAPDGRDHWPYCYSGVVAGCGIARGAQYGESDQTASSPKDKPVHPNDLLATVYYALGIDPDMIVLNHLNQPRELVKGKVVSDLWA